VVGSVLVNVVKNIQASRQAGNFFTN